MCFAALATLVVNEVLYDPDGADTGREFVEIVNVGAAPQSLQGLELQVGDGARPGSWQLAWRGGAADTLGAGELLVVGGDSIPARQHDLAASLQNGPDALRLWRDDLVLDLLGYGALTAPELYEGAPAPDVAGLSLARIPDGVDTDTNSADFRPARPTPGRLNAPRQGLALALVAPDPTRLWPWRTLAVQATVRNVGLDPVEPGAYALRATLRTVFGEPYLDAWSLGPPLAVEPSGVAPGLAPGDSAAHGISWSAALGLFALSVELVGADEDSTDNSASAWLRIGAGPVVVSEILFAPEVGASEWIEVYNRDVRSHDLNAWTVADATGKPVRIVAPQALPPGAFAVVASDSTSPIAAAAGTLRLVVSPWPALNNSDGDDGFADAVVLRDPEGIVQDAVVYSAAWGAGRGRSIERLTADPDARGLLWAPCKDPSGSTPGRQNSATAPPAWSSQLALHPNPFSPDGDGNEDLLGIAFEVPGPCRGFQLHVYDTHGRRRRALAADRLGPGPRRLAWDGSDDGGAGLETGVYVLRLELLGGCAATELRSIGLVRR